jgi:DNA-binding CsgD family transcriptional regulator
MNELDIKRYYTSGKNTYLTKQQMICAAYLMHSYTAKQIAKIMNLSYRTVENHIETIKQKFSCQDRSELINQLFSEFPSYKLLFKNSR